MKRLVGISTGCFYNPFVRMDINKQIAPCAKLDIDGIEILFGEGERLLSQKLNKNSIRILKDLPFNTFHVPFHLKGKALHYGNDTTTKKIMKRIYQICDKVDIKNINVHPHQIKDYRIFDIENYQHSIENMEKRHMLTPALYGRILKAHPSFKLVLDTTHAGEANEVELLFRRFHKKVIYSHLSANYFSHLHIPLHALQAAYLKPLSIIKKGKFPVVLESSIGTPNIKEYQNEVAFVRNWLS